VTPSSCTFGESPSSIVIIIRDEIYRNLIWKEIFLALVENNFVWNAKM
jgi:hypothetical protein